MFEMEIATEQMIEEAETGKGDGQEVWHVIRWVASSSSARVSQGTASRWGLLSLPWGTTGQMAVPRTLASGTSYLETPSCDIG